MVRGSFKRMSHTFTRTNSLARKEPHLKISPITGFFLTAAGFTAQTDITQRRGELAPETRKFRGRGGNVLGRGILGAAGL